LSKKMFAGSMGFGYGFARHFSPAPPGPAIRAYRAAFTPSDQFPKPHVILGVAVIVAPTDEEAEYLVTSSDVVWVRRHRGEMQPFPSPADASSGVTSETKARVGKYTCRIGSPAW